jgi:hypothetical protein
MNKQLFVLLFLFGYVSVSNATDKKSDSTAKEKFKPSIQVGGFFQLQGVVTQDRPINPALDANRQWSRQVQIWRARFMLGATLSKNTSLFMQTELPAPIGAVSSTGTKTMQSVSPILLDAQIEHSFNKYVSLIAGMQLVGINRNGLQSPVSLMGLEFGWYQYPYNLFQNQPLQNNFGRDIGVNTRGFLFNDRLEWRAGVFRGRGVDPYSPFRTVFRLNYNFLEREKGLYYTGTTLGKQKLFSVGGGLDQQGSYSAVALDSFLDLPIGTTTSLTWQGSYMHLTGGNSTAATSFTGLIPSQSILFTELGFYSSKLKLQPYAKFETQQMNITNTQYQLNPQTASYGLPAIGSTSDRATFNKLASNTRFGGGINYFANDFNFHLKLQYEQIFYGRYNSLGQAETRSGGEVKLQLTFFMFQ